MSKPKPTWTRAGVRHKTPRWYWVRRGATDRCVAARLWTDGAGPTVQLPRAPEPWSWRYAVEKGYERSVAPIREPGE